MLFDGAAPVYVASGHVVYYKGGAYRAVLIVYFPSPAGTVVRLLTFADIRAT